MTSFGFRKSKYDPCLYIRGKGDNILYVTVYVDDLIMGGSSIDLIDEFKVQIKDKFKMKDLGELKYVLGMEVSRDTKGIKLSQKGYINAILKRFGFLNCKPVKTPLPPGLQLPLGAGVPYDNTINEDDEFYYKGKDRYREIIGSLMYLMVSTRPDLAYAVSYLARFLNNHNKLHMAAAHHILCYIKYTEDIGIRYAADGPLDITGYSDSDWASDKLTRRSTSGYLFMMANGPVSWKSKQQTVVALSSSEAEYIALSAAAQEAIAIRSLASEFGVSPTQSVLIYEDNNGAIAMSKNPVSYSKTKHIHIRYHFIREKIYDGDIVVKYLPTNDMLADMMTKNLATCIYEGLRCRFMTN
jgi:hypothetical protein